MLRLPVRQAMSEGTLEGEFIPRISRCCTMSRSGAGGCPLIPGSPSASLSEAIEDASLVIYFITSIYGTPIFDQSL